MLICISSCVEFHTQKVEEMQISDMLKSEDILENVQAFQVRSCWWSFLVFIVMTCSWNERRIAVLDKTDEDM